jgi:hypothetical protein
VDVLTTCAASDTTWANEFPAGAETLNGVQVRRFRVSRPASASAAARRSERVFTQMHSIADELRWLDASTPNSPSLLRYLRKNEGSYDFCLFVGYRSALTYFGTHVAASRAILVPRADADPAIGARIFRDVFQGARAILFDSPEERSLIDAVCAAHDVPNAVIGAGADVAQNPQPARFRHKQNIRGPFAIYVGRLDDRSCGNLVPLFDRYSHERGSRLSLVLVGDGPVAPPKHPKIRHVGALDDAEKFDAMSAAEVVVWRVVGRKYHEMLVDLQKRPARAEIAPIPGWLARRRRDVPPLAGGGENIA